ncbi:putative fatty acyl-CoA reductase [Halotydeus destructor]|nr:putative fatty acyl-CoA reductase [Halotydeus destructor]
MALDKIVAIKGDVTENDAGMSSSDLELVCSSVDIVFHAAACIKLTQGLREATKNNMAATLNVINVCKQIRSLKATVYIGSLASWFSKTRLEERTYPEDHVGTVYENARTFVDHVQDMSEDECSKLTDSVVGKWPKYPNCYCFTKTLCELLWQQEGKDLKVAILRSPLLFSALQDPEPGWFDQPQASSSLVSLYANGVIRRPRLDPDYDFSHMPIDMLANAAIAASWAMAHDTMGANCQIFNLSTDTANKFTVRDLSIVASKLGHEYPSMRQLRPPKGEHSWKPSGLYYRIYSFFTYNLFSTLVDTLLTISGEKPVLGKMTNKITGELNVIADILRDNVTLVDANMVNLYSSNSCLMSEKDKAVFYYDVTKINWTKLLEAHHLRFRSKLMKECETNLKSARKRMIFISALYRILSLATKVAIFSPLVYVLIKYLPVMLSNASSYEHSAFMFT